MALNYSSKHDISYANYNNKTIPWKVNASIIYQNNQITDPSLNIGTNNNNLVIESSQNNILFITSENNNKKVIVKNNMTIKNLDVSNTLTTKLNDASSITLNNKLYLPERSVNIIGDLKVGGSITIISSTATGLVKSESQFINVTLSGSRFTDVSIVNSNISYSDFSNVNIINSYIYNIPFGYGFDKSNNSYPNKAIFSDVSLQRLVLDSSINSYINFAANANSANSIIIRSSDDYSKLKINKPLNIGIGIGETISTISNVSIFYGTISCNTLYYSQLVPDIRLNTYFDVSIGQVSVSGNNIPVNNSFNIGSTNYKFNEIISNTFVGDLSGAVSSANDLRKNLDMSFNNLDIYGTFTLNRQNLNQFLSGDLISIVAADISFTNANNKVRDLSISLYSKMDVDLCLNSNFTKISLLDASLLVLNNSITSISSDIYTRTGFDLCLNINFAKISLVDASLLVLNNSITSISASVYSKSDFDLCLNRNVLRTSDVSAILSVVTNPTRIYPMLGYIDSSLNKVTNAKVTNELAFPYAITYIDDLVEDTNIRESLARIVSSQDGSIVVNATAIGVSYEINTNVQNWEWHRTNAISVGRSLAVILNAEQNERVRLVNVAANIGSTFIGALRTSKPNPPNLNNTSEYWQWTNGARWSYTNFGGNEPNNSGSGEPYVELYSNGIWNDIYTDTTRPAIYMNTLSIGNGSFKISENNNNKSYYIKSSASALPSNISTSYSCIAITNDGMFVALGKATNVTVYMKNASGWTTLGAQINVDFTRYTDTCCNILWDGYDPAMYRNLQNLAINFNYNTGLTSSQLLLAFGDTRTSIKVYSYRGGTWALSNGIYSVVGGSWSTTSNPISSPITFTTVGTTTFTSTTSETIEYLVVGGGGAGGVGIGGGGGAGGVLSGTTTLPAGSYTITVGAGGAGGGGNSPGNDGGSSSISTLVVATGGGGGGGGTAPNGRVGGSGGGGNGGTSAGSGGTGIAGQGFAGASNTNGYTGGGGGGAGGPGSGGNGGIGITSTLTGTTKYYAGGGGGGSNQTGNYVTGVAYGGSFTIANGTYGGGNGANMNGYKPDFTDALANTGGGGGGNNGGNGPSGSGGSGIVVIRYISLLQIYNATTAEINNNNFGYFVTFSQSPSVLGFTVANKFYTYNCTNSDGTQRGSVQTLPSSNGSYTNIIAFKMSSDAEKIIVSNTYYVFVYKWNINTTNWSLLTTINLVSANITASIQVLRSTTGATVSTVSVVNYPATVIQSETPWLGEPFSAAINFDGTIIANTRGARNADIIQVWKYINNSWTQLASPSPPGMSYYPELSNDGTICAYSGGQSSGGFEWHLVGSTGFVEVRRYNNTTSVWDQIFKRMETNWARHERSTLSKDGKVLVITNIWRGADGTENNIGYINVYKYVSDMNWTPMGQTLSGTATMTNFATGVALSHTGDFMVCSTRMYSSYRGIARIYRFNTPVANNWNLIGEITGPVAGKSFGWQQAAMSSNGQIISIGSYGTIYVYKYISDMNWTQIGAIRGPNIYDEHFYFPTLSSDGTIVGLGQGGAVATRGDTPFVGNRAIQLWKYVNTVWTLIYDTLSPFQCDVMVACLSGNGRSFFICSRAVYPIVYTVIDTTYTIYSFKTIGSSIFVPVFSGTVEVLLVGGGGGGGVGHGTGGGGGGGGVVYMPNVSVNIGQRYNIVVGAGGSINTNGQNTTAFGAIAAGGGASNGNNGGCGGGAGNAETLPLNTAGTGTGNSLGPNSGTSYSTNGGSCTTVSPGNGGNGAMVSAGGGGAGGAGPSTNSQSFTVTQGGNGSGGIGIQSDILGTNYYWAGGGGGGAYAAQGGWGGLGGGGGGGSYALSSGPGGGSALNSPVSVHGGSHASSGGDNTGGGGGGGVVSRKIPGSGGSGIVIIRHLQTLPQSSSSTLLTFNIPAGPRSLDISNISSDDCVFAIGFPDKVIDTSANMKARGYVEYWKFSNNILTRLATLVPRKRNIDSSNVETDEYFFSGGGIKITNANTILVAPNFKFHFNSTNKNYTLATSNLDWSTHNNTSNAKLITGRELASIENEADNELVKITARNNVVWIGAMRTAINNPTGITSAEWQWSDTSSSWNYTSFTSGQPNNFSEKRIQSLSGTWYDTLETVTSRAIYMTRLQYSLNTFNVFDRFYFHSSGFTSSYANTAISSTVIAKWIRMDSPSTLPIEFRGNGDLVSNGKGIFTISDIRLKENIVDSTPKLEDLLKVRVVNYNLKGCKDNTLIGVVAQELEQLFPTLVNNGELSHHDIYLGKTESYKSVKYSCFDVILIKAFQEQVAIINKLTSQLDEIDDKTKLLKAISQDFVILKQELDLLKRENELFKLNINEILKLI